MDSLGRVDRRSQLIASGDEAPLIDLSEDSFSQPPAVDALSSSGGPIEQAQPGCFQSFINWLTDLFRMIFCCACGTQDSKPGDDNNPLNNETENLDLLSPTVESPAPKSPSDDEEETAPLSNGSSGTPSAEDIQEGVSAAFAATKKQQRATLTRSSTANAPVDSEKESRQKPADSNPATASNPAAANAGDFYANAGKTLAPHLQPTAPPPPVKGEKKKKKQEQLPDQSQDQVSSSTTTAAKTAPVGQPAISANAIASQASNLKKAPPPRRMTMSQKPATKQSTIYQTWETGDEATSQPNAASQQDEDKHENAIQVLQSGRGQLLSSTPVVTSKHSSSRHNSSSSTSSATRGFGANSSTFATNLDASQGELEAEDSDSDDENPRVKPKGKQDLGAAFLGRSKQPPVVLPEGVNPDEVSPRMRQMAALVSPGASQQNTANAVDEEVSDTESSTSEATKQERLAKFAKGFKTSDKLTTALSPPSSRHASRVPSVAPSPSSSIVNPPDRKSFRKTASMVKKDA